MADAVHATFNTAGGRTMRCDFCNARNTSVLNECSDCQLHICYPCADQGRLDSDPRHHLVLDYDDSSNADADGDTREANLTPTHPGRHIEAQVGGTLQSGSSTAVSSRASSASPNPHTPTPYSNGNPPTGDQHPIPVISLGRDYDAPGAVLADKDGENWVPVSSQYHHGPVILRVYPDGTVNGYTPDYQPGVYTFASISLHHYGAHTYEGNPGHHRMPQQDAVQAIGLQYYQVPLQNVQGLAGPYHHASALNAHMPGPAGARPATQYGFPPPPPPPPPRHNGFEGFQQNPQMLLPAPATSSTPQWYERQRPPAMGPYPEPPQVPRLYRPGVEAGGPRAAVHVAPRNLGHPAGKRATANLHARPAVFAGGYPEGGGGYGGGQHHVPTELRAREMACAEALQQLHDHPVVHHPSQRGSYPSPQQAQAQAQTRAQTRAQPPSRHTIPGRLSVYQEDSELRPRQPRWAGADAPSHVYHDEKPEIPRAPAEPNSPSQQRVSNTSEDLADSRKEEEEEEKNGTIKDTHLFLTPKSESGPPSPSASAPAYPSRSAQTTSRPGAGTEALEFEAMAGNPVLAGVRRREGEVAALDMASGASALVAASATSASASSASSAGAGAGAAGREDDTARLNGSETKRKRENAVEVSGSRAGSGSGRRAGGALERESRREKKRQRKG